MKSSKLLDEDMSILFEERTYKMAKRMLQNTIATINQIAHVFDESLQFEGGELDADRLLDKIELALQRKKQHHTDRVQVTMRNNEENWLVNYLMRKKVIVEEIENFVDCFNQLDKESRAVMYYSFFENESNYKVESRINSSQYRIQKIKHRATNHLVNSILLNQLLNSERPEPISLGLFSCPNTGGGA